MGIFWASYNIWLFKVIVFDSMDMGLFFHPRFYEFPIEQDWTKFWTPHIWISGGKNRTSQFLVKSFQLSDLILVGYQIVTNWGKATKVFRSCEEAAVKPIHLKFPLKLQYQSFGPTKCTLDERRPTGACKRILRAGNKHMIKIWGWPRIRRDTSRINIQKKEYGAQGKKDELEKWGNRANINRMIFNCMNGGMGGLSSKREEGLER